VLPVSFKVTSIGLRTNAVPFVVILTGPRGLKTTLRSYSPRSPLLQGVHAPSSNYAQSLSATPKGRGCGGKNWPFLQNVTGSPLAKPYYIYWSVALVHTASGLYSVLLSAPITWRGFEGGRRCRRS
jgi:hypothetical protein